MIKGLFAIFFLYIGTLVAFFLGGVCSYEIAGRFGGFDRQSKSLVPQWSVTTLFFAVAVLSVIFPVHLYNFIIPLVGYIWGSVRAIKGLTKLSLPRKIATVGLATCLVLLVSLSVGTLSVVHLHSLYMGK